MANAERAIWHHIRAHRFHGLKFKRQEPIGTFVVDFICYDAGLVVELDGGQHAAQVEEDNARTAWLESRGYRVLRFWNNDVLSNMDGVLEELESIVGGRQRHPK